LPEPVNYGYFLIEGDFLQLADQAVPPPPPLPRPPPMR
jgi:hypothetical protein